MCMVHRKLHHCDATTYEEERGIGCRVCRRTREENVPKSKPVCAPSSTGAAASNGSSAMLLLTTNAGSNTSAASVGDKAMGADGGGNAPPTPPGRSSRSVRGGSASATIFKAAYLNPWPLQGTTQRVLLLSKGVPLTLLEGRTGNQRRTALCGHVQRKTSTLLRCRRYASSPRAPATLPAGHPLSS